MDVKISKDPKIAKMFRRSERFLDDEGLETHKVIQFHNEDTGRVFAVLTRPETYEEIIAEMQGLGAELKDAMETITILEDDNALLALIDAQNDVLMERVLTGDSDKEDGAGWPTDGVCGDDECSCRTTEASSPETAGFEGMGPIFESLGVDTSNFADTTIKEHFNVEEVVVTLQEYEELLNLRQKRARDKNTIYQLECKFNAMKKGAATLQAQRDEYAGRLGIALDDLADADGVTRWIR